MNFSFGFDSLFGEPMTVTFEQYVGNQLVKSQQLSGNPMMLQSQFQQLMEQVAQLKGKQPIKIRMVRYEDVWDMFEQKMRKNEYSIEFKNWSDEE